MFRRTVIFSLSSALEYTFLKSAYEYTFLKSAKIRVHEYTFLKSAYGLTGELLFVSINML
jgi:hypothetical protein